MIPHTDVTDSARHDAGEVRFQGRTYLMHYRFVWFFPYVFPCAGLLGLLIFSKGMGTNAPSKSLPLSIALVNRHAAMNSNGAYFERLPAVGLERLPNVFHRDQPPSDASEDGLDSVALDAVAVATRPSHAGTTQSETFDFAPGEQQSGLLPPQTDLDTETGDVVSQTVNALPIAVSPNITLFADIPHD